MDRPGTLVVAANPADEIIGTCETLDGWCSIAAMADDGGEIYWDHDGSDGGEYAESSETKTDALGRVLFQARSGGEYTLGQLALQLDDGTLISCEEEEPDPEANARGSCILIHDAAPDLLAALEAMFELFSETRPGAEAVEMAAAAIAKAKGVAHV